MCSACWLGGVWAPANCMLMRGLKRYRRTALATRLAQTYYAAVVQVFERTGTFFEDYAPDAAAPERPAQADCCCWTGIVPITLYHEFISKAPSLHSSG